MDDYVREQLIQHRMYLNQRLDDQRERKAGLIDMVRMASETIAEIESNIASVDAALAAE